MPREKQPEVGIPERPTHKALRIFPYLSGSFSGPSGKILFVVAVVSLVNLAVTIALVAEVFSLSADLKEADAATASLLEEVASLRPGSADSSFADVQPIGLGFSLVDFKAEPVDGGVKVTGSIINGTSLDYYEAHFKVIFDEERSAELSIPTLLAGHAAPFEAIVPPSTDKSVPKKIGIVFAGSQVSFF